MATSRGSKRSAICDAPGRPAALGENVRARPVPLCEVPAGDGHAGVEPARFERVELPEQRREIDRAAVTEDADDSVAIQFVEDL